MIDIFKAILLGVVEGITEWLPISSTGHLILVEKFINLNISPEFKEMFDVVIQLGAIFAVVLLFWHKLWPLTNLQESSGTIRLVGKVGIKRASVGIWARVIIGCLPAGVIGLLFDDWIDEVFYKEGIVANVVAATLIIYGVLFIFIEKINKDKTHKITTMRGLDYKSAFLIGCFQVLALIPGTSRSGATILGAILLGASRTIAAEYSFYLSVPVMFGASLLKLLKFGLHFESLEIIILITGMVVSFIVSIIAIKFLLEFIRKNSFTVFGYYRIALGLLVLIYFNIFA